MIKSALLLALAGLSESQVIDKPIKKKMQRQSTAAPPDYTDAGLADFHNYTAVIELDIGT